MICKSLHLNVGIICMFMAILLIRTEGRLIETIKAKSCLEIRYITPNITAINGLYTIYIGANEIQTVYCDFQSDPPFVWTLVESYTRGISIDPTKKARFNFQNPYIYDYPYNECSPQFKAYRLGKKSMTSIAASSRTTHWRATCNFPNKTYPLSHRDYWRNSMCNYNIMKISATIYGCYWVDYINVRGYACRNCYLPFYTNRNVHLHFQSARSKYYCHRYVFPSPFTSLPTECDFGHFHLYNVDHGCSATKDSTTNWWFGGVYQPETNLIHYSLL